LALKSIEIMENEKVLENVLDNEDYFRQSLLEPEGHPDRRRRFAGHRLLLGRRTGEGTR